MNNTLKELLERPEMHPDIIGKMFCLNSVGNDAFNAAQILFDLSMSEDKLKDQGYAPVSDMNLLWIKNEI